MNEKNLRALNLLATLGMACGLAACTTQEVKSDGGAGGHIGGGLGGTIGGGTGGGTGSQYPFSEGVLCLPPAQMLTDFTYDSDSGAMDQVRFGTFGTTLSGGQSAYGSFTGNVTANDWHIMGTVSDYSGFNLYFDNVNSCNKIDASAFGGIQFTIWGAIGDPLAPLPLSMGISTLDDAVVYGWLDSKDSGTAGATPPGKCTPMSGTNQYYHPGCADPTASINVTGTQTNPQTVTLHWADFAGGAPSGAVTPTGILAVYWNVPWMPPAAPYPVDIHIDNLTFIPK